MDKKENRFYKEKPLMPKNKVEFAEMLMREYGHDEETAKDCAAIVAGHGAFNPILHDKEAMSALILLISKGYKIEDICVAMKQL